MVHPGAQFLSIWGPARLNPHTICFPSATWGQARERHSHRDKMKGIKESLVVPHLLLPRQWPCPLYYSIHCTNPFSWSQAYLTCRPKINCCYEPLRFLRLVVTYRKLMGTPRNTDRKAFRWCAQKSGTEDSFTSSPWTQQVFAKMDSASNCYDINFAALCRIFCSYFNPTHFNSSPWLNRCWTWNRTDGRRKMMLSPQVHSLMVETDISMSNSNHRPWKINPVTGQESTWQ